MCRAPFAQKPHKQCCGQSILSAGCEGLQLHGLREQQLLSL